MRNTFSKTLEHLVQQDESILFLTGDLGYNALENLRSTMGDRFINTGVAEQNMVGMAAGLANQGFQVFCYSIAPFIVYRCLEQTRNDVCFHKLPVYLVGNGGGYGYGIMGTSHHALEDIALLSSMPNMNCYIPSFTEDVPLCIKALVERKLPAYLRLGADKVYPNAALHNLPEIEHIHIANEPKVTIIGASPAMTNLFYIPEFEALKQYIDIFCVRVLPYPDWTPELRTSIRTTQRILIVEEHIENGALGSRIALDCLKAGIHLKGFSHQFAVGYPDGLYGSQGFHQKKSGLDTESLQLKIKQLMV